MAGEANAEQQQLALKCIVEDVSGAYELSYSPDSPYDTAFAEGRRFVGMQIAKLQGIQLRTTYGAQPIQTRSKHG